MAICTEQLPILAETTAQFGTSNVDNIDHKLIALLRQDARCPVAMLSRKLGISRATVRSRIDRLLGSGAIGGFTIMVRRPADRHLVRAVTMIAVEGNRSPRVLDTLYGFPEVRRLHSTNGRWDIVAELESETLGEFDTLLNKIRSIDGVAATETSILLSSPKNLP